MELILNHYFSSPQKWRPVLTLFFYLHNCGDKSELYFFSSTFAEAQTDASFFSPTAVGVKTDRFFLSDGCRSQSQRLILTSTAVRVQFYGCFFSRRLSEFLKTPYFIGVGARKFSYCCKIALNKGKTNKNYTYF